MFAVSISVAALVALASGANITFASDVNCGGVALYGAPLLDTVPCTDVAGMEDAALSVIVSGVSPSQVVTFYSDSACTQQITALTQDNCYTPGGNGFGSFLITDSATATTDVVPYGIKMSNYKDMAQTSPYDIDAIPLGRIALGYSKLAVGATLSFAAAVAGCVAVMGTGPDPVALFACIAVPIATLLSLWGAHDLATAGKELKEHIAMRNGAISANHHRSLDASADALNEMYMHSLMNATIAAGVQTRRVGLLKRDLGAGPQLSPIMELDGDESTGKWHMAAHWNDEIGGFVHQISHASDSEFELQERNTPYTYNSIRWNKNGIDATFCKYQASDDGFGGKKGPIYQNYFGELKCYAKPDIKNAKYVQIDMYNEDGKIRTEAHFAPYNGDSSKSAIGQYKVCLPNKVAGYDSDCAAGPS